MNDSTPIFINLSNHPSSGWGEEQLSAAIAYGEIVDKAFPIVAPHATADDVKHLAEECVEHILEYGSPTNLTVHIMGEMTLCYAIISRLLARGIRCVASTTERIVTEVDGKKVSEFHFVQFREYESYRISRQ